LKIKSTAILALSIVGAILVYYVLVSSETVYADKQSMSMPQMCQTMMNQVPQDVTFFPKSGQLAFVGEEANIVLLVKDKKTNKSLDNAVVILHIEKGAPMESMENMSMMDMMGRMFEAENIGDGQYLVKFTPNEKGYYTMHTHAIPPGKSMMSMMNNHMDIGIVAK
jgi:hypothetical protein